MNGSKSDRERLRVPLELTCVQEGGEWGSRNSLCGKGRQVPLLEETHVLAVSAERTHHSCLRTDDATGWRGTNIFYNLPHYYLLNTCGIYMYYSLNYFNGLLLLITLYIIKNTITKITNIINNIVISIFISPNIINNIVHKLCSLFQAGIEESIREPGVLT